MNLSAQQIEISSKALKNKLQDLEAKYGKNYVFAVHLGLYIRKTCDFVDIILDNGLRSEDWGTEVLNLSTYLFKDICAALGVDPQVVLQDVVGISNSILLAAIDLPKKPGDVQ